MNRLAVRLMLGMLAVSAVSFVAIPVAERIATNAILARLPADLREAVVARTTPHMTYGLRRPPARGAREATTADAGGSRAPDPAAATPEAGSARAAAAEGAPAADAGSASMGALAVQNDRLFELLADLRAAQLRAVAIGIGTSLVLAVLLALAFTRAIAVPFESLTAAASKIAGGELGTRMDLRGQRLQTREARRLSADFNAMARALDGYERERTAMIADIAHELRTPLATLQMRLDALHDGLVPFDDAEATLLLERTEYLARMVDDLRLLSLADGGRLSLRLEPIDVSAYLRGVEEALRDVAVHDGARLELRAPDEPLMVRADADRLFQILRNLIENAAAAMAPVDSITPTAGDVVVAASRAGAAASITVRDHGPGIDPAHLRTILQHFSRGRRSDTRLSGGRGLGLAIVGTLVALHGGTVTAANQRPGVAFEVRLPLVAETETA